MIVRQFLNIRLIIITFAILVITASLYAQSSGLRIDGRPEKSLDEIVGVKDANGRLCAAIQVVSNMEGFKYDSYNGVVKVDDRPGKDMVYLQPDERVLEIYLSGYGPLKIILSDIGIQLKSKDVWRIRVSAWRDVQPQIKEIQMAETTSPAPSERINGVKKDVLVLDVDDDKILLDIGRIDGIGYGEIYEIVAEKGRITHPQTGELLSVEYESTCAFRTTDVEEKLTKAIILSDYTDSLPKINSMVIIRSAKHGVNYGPKSKRVFLAPTFEKITNQEEMGTDSKFIFDRGFIFGSCLGIDFNNHFGISFGFIVLSGVFDNHTTLGTTMRNIEYNYYAFSFSSRYRFISGRSVTPYVSLGLIFGSDNTDYGLYEGLGGNLGLGVLIPISKFLHINIGFVSGILQSNVDEDDSAGINWFRIAPEINIYVP